MYVSLWLKTILASSIVNKLKIMIVLLHVFITIITVAIVHSIYSQSVPFPAPPGQWTTTLGGTVRLRPNIYD